MTNTRTPRRTNQPRCATTVDSTVLLLLLKTNTTVVRVVFLIYTGIDRAKTTPAAAVL